MYCPKKHVTALSDANRLGLHYGAEAARLPWQGPIWDVHMHINSLEAGLLVRDVAQRFGIVKVFSMSPLEIVPALREALGDFVEFIAVPNYANRHDPATFTTDWLSRIERFAALGVRICKFWAAPRGRDFHPALRLDHPLRREAMELARSHGMMFMTHVGDPDTWFATHYSDARRYGRRDEHYAIFEKCLDDFADVPWLAAHMAGHPEDLEHLQGLLDRHPNLVVDTAATKWMVRELSRDPAGLRGFCERNPGRVLFGSDIVATPADMTWELFASRWWALRTLLETDYQGPSPIVDPDLVLMDPGCDRKSTATLHGAALAPAVLAHVYQYAAQQWMSGYTWAG